MKILTNGCSFSCGPGSWPYVMQKELECELLNIALSSAGNIYIHDTTIAELSKRKYDFAVIMWSGIARFDMKVADITQFSDSKGTSYYQSMLHDFPAKKVGPIEEEAFIEKDWLFCHGSTGYDPLPDLHKTIVAYTSYKEHAYNTLIKMISLQSVLKQLKIDFIFTCFNNYYERELLLWPELYGMLDKSHMYFKDDLSKLTKRNNGWDETRHPNAKCHDEWGKLMASEIRAKYND